MIQFELMLFKCENDCETYITLLYDLAKLLEHENGFPIYAIVVKNCIAGFRCFRKFDPGYTQEFYLRWKTIVSRMDVLKRANTFYSLIDKFKIVVGHLRTAASRTEQLAVMSVLRIYIECVPVTQLCRLHEHDNIEIIKLVAGFMENPSILNQNEFLHHINSKGDCIESLKPKKIICRKLNIDMDDANHSLWLDFNKTEQTVSFVTVSLADCGNQTFATTHRVKLRESVKDNHLLKINGFWNVISGADKSQSSGQRVTVRVYFLDKTEELISAAVKTVFRFMNSGDVAESATQECTLFPETVVPSELISLGRAEPTPPKSSHNLQRVNIFLPLEEYLRNQNSSNDAPSDDSSVAPNRLDGHENADTSGKLLQEMMFDDLEIEHAPDAEEIIDNITIRPTNKSLNQTLRFEIGTTAGPSDDNGFAVDENSSNHNTQDEHYTDGIRVDEHGTVYDDKGCVFTDNDHLQLTVKFYIANDGLHYLKSENYAFLPPHKREKCERQLRTVQRMMERGLGRFHDQRKSMDTDPYAPTVAEWTVQGNRRKRRATEVIPTLSSSDTIGTIRTCYRKLTKPNGKNKK
ncbi:hypothetical protein HA402_014809 [Bradysia odoriphaga]|nr:hypothetical protein HA402_014809 [Bradysia odoriphaga]